MICLFTATSGPHVASFHPMLLYYDVDEGTRIDSWPGDAVRVEGVCTFLPRLRGCSPGTLVSSHVPDVHDGFVGESALSQSA